MHQTGLISGIFYSISAIFNNIVTNMSSPSNNDTINDSIDEEFEKVKALMLEQLTEFSVLLENIHEKYHHAVEEQILKEDDVSFEDISKSLTRESIQEFANEFFVQNQRRVTIELFASRVDEDEARFTMASSLGLGKKAYTITSLAEMAQLKAAASN